ncbi:MAG: sugar phosphate isomerase/epimerase [Deltaproteobacteria bacterium]|nr:sugar phosphate isomerase/epimerase [Deltaproteobacteria bacterium]
MKDKVHVHIPYPTLLKRFKDVLEAGLNPEVYFSATALDDYRLADIRSIKKDLDTRGLRTTIHGPYIDMSPGGPDEKVRGVTIERFNQVFQIASVLKPRAIIFHPGFDRWRFDGNEELWLKQSLKTWPQFAEKAESIGTTMAIENVYEDTPDTIKALVEGINFKNFRFCFDPGHSNIFSNISIMEWLKAVGHYIVELHLHDNNGKEDNHLAIGDGNIDFKGLFRMVKGYTKEPIYTIEAYTEEAMWRGLDRLEGYFSDLH